MPGNITMTNTTPARPRAVRKTPARKAPATPKKPATEAPKLPAAPVKPAALADTRVPGVRQACKLTADEYAQLTALKKRASRVARPMKRGELLRAGLHALLAMDDAALFAALDRVPPRA